MSARPFAVGERVSMPTHGGRRLGTVTRHDFPSLVWVQWDGRRAPTRAHAACLRPEPDGIRETCWDCGESRECRPMVGSCIVDDGVPFCAECFAPHLRLSAEAEADAVYEHCERFEIEASESAARFDAEAERAEAEAEGLS